VGLYRWLSTLQCDWPGFAGFIEIGRRCFPVADDAPTAHGSRPAIDTTVPHSARIWNYWLGGEDNYEVDRAAGEQIRRLHPMIGDYARADRLFLGQAVRHLAEGQGIRQFLDIGSGLPTVDNTHEVAQAAAPESRVVYVDNDPLVAAHAAGLLTSTPEGATSYIQADLRDAGRILAEAARTLDFSKPVALTMLGVVIFIGDDEDPYGTVRRFVDALPSGSYLVLSHTITRPDMPDIDAAVAFWNEHGTPRLTQRTPEQITRFFDGLELVEPGVVSCSRWRPGPAPSGEPGEVAMFGGVARKP
jgi:O-methyltransferase involved in polyketide biosynthesis